jgi:hypothetical protein
LPRSIYPAGFYPGGFNPRKNDKMKSTRELTEIALLAAYDQGGPAAVLDLCEPHELPFELCEPCEEMTPTWQCVCAVCWTAR